MNKQRHILVFPVSLWHGMAGTRRVKVLMDELASKGNYSFSNLIISHPKEFCGRAKTGSEQNIPFCEIGYKYYNVFYWFRFWYAGIRFIKRMRKTKQKNFFYCYQEIDIVTLPLLVFARWLGYKIVVDVVEDNAFLRKSYQNWLAYIRVRSGIWLLNKLPVYADAALAVSTYLLQKTQGVVKERIPVALIPVSVNLRLFTSQSVSPDSMAGKQSYHVFYGGSFSAKDGIEFLLQAIKLTQAIFPKIKLVLTGVGSEMDMATFWTYVTMHQLSAVIDYRGYLSDEDYIRTLQDCDIFCMTRTNSSFANAGFPFKLGEMLATGKPVIATKIGDIENYLADFENALLVDPENSSQIADRLLWIMKNYSQAGVIGLRGKQVAETCFSASRVAEKLDSVLNNLIQTP